MFLKIFSLIAILVLAACSTTDGDPAAIEDGTLSGNSSAASSGRIENGSGVSTGAISSGDLSDLTPGSQEELIATVGDRVFFGFNSVKLTATAQTILKRQVEWLDNNPKIKVTIEGHCDERGTREYNLALGERRAIAVRNYLIGRGISPERIATITYGKEHPEYLGSDEAAWSKNRRSVTTVN